MASFLVITRMYLIINHTRTNEEKKKRKKESGIRSSAWSRGRIDRPASNVNNRANIGRVSIESNVKIEGLFVFIESEIWLNARGPVKHIFRKEIYATKIYVTKILLEIQYNRVESFTFNKSMSRNISTPISR